MQSELRGAPLDASTAPLNLEDIVVRVPDETDPPANFTLKESWPMADRATEGKMFAEMRGLLGVPDVLESYIFARTTSLTPRNVRFWPYRQNEASASPEERVQLRVLSGHEGRNITDARGPREMLECILHAMSGNYQVSGQMNGI